MKNFLIVSTILLTALPATAGQFKRIWINQAKPCITTTAGTVCDWYNMGSISDTILYKNCKAIGGEYETVVDPDANPYPRCVNVYLDNGRRIVIF